MTYVEEVSIVKALEKLASESGLTVSNLLRQAAWEYVKSNQKPGSTPITRDASRNK